MRAIWNSRFFIALSALAFSDLKVASARTASFLSLLECSWEDKVSHGFMHRRGDARREEGKQSAGRQLTLTFVRASKMGSLRTMMSVRENIEGENRRCCGRQMDLGARGNVTDRIQCILSVPEVSLF